MNNLNITNILSQKKKSSILVIGEAMLDSYMRGNANRICREAPVPIVEIHNNEKHPGAAANTAFNLSHLGAETYFMSVVGQDTEGETIKNLLVKNGVDVSSVLTDNQRQTMTKQRIAAGGQLLVRFDTGSTHAISNIAEDKIIDRLIALYPDMDAVIVSDYGYGILTPKIIDVLSRLQKHIPKILAIDSKYLDRYASLHPAIVKPNFQESVSLLGLSFTPPVGERIPFIAPYNEMLHEKTGADIIALTVDIEGSLIFEKGKRTYQTFTNPVQNSKAAGAGDTYTSAFTLALSLGAQTKTAAEIASAASSIVVQKEGTAVCTKDELLLFFASNTKYIQKKQKLPSLIFHLKKQGKKIVFTNGCFDILHSGHVDYLNRSKQLGDILIVGLNSDDSVKRLKGKNRPINSLTDRIQVLSGLSSVDYIIPFSTNTPIFLIKKIRPDVFVKGGDYTKELLPEAPFVEKAGGKVEILPFVKDKSTSNIIQQIVSPGTISN